MKQLKYILKSQRNIKEVEGKMINIRLLKGDCLERMKEIEDSSIDMIMADPPYGTTACKWDSVIPLEPM